MSSPITVAPTVKAHTPFLAPNRLGLLRSVADKPSKPVPRGSAYHLPVFADAIASRFHLPDNPRLLDCTVGDGGHTIRFLQAAGPDGRVLALDRDPEALQRTRQRLQERRLQEQVTLVHAAFGQVYEIACAHGFVPVDNILLDLGFSSHQIGKAERGFSLQRDGPLDMRMDQSQPFTASDIVNAWPEAALSDLLFALGEERQARRVARAIVAARPIGSTARLAEVVRQAMPRRGSGRIHPATRTFQALRIKVNDELEQLRQALPQVLDLLAPGGRLFVIAFHSLEDRAVKRFLQAHSRRVAVNKYGDAGRRPRQRPPLSLLIRGALKPDAEEMAANPRSRSARLRVAEKTGA